MLVRGATPDPAPFRLFVRALTPFLLAQWLLLIVILLAPALVHVGENARSVTRLPEAPVSSDEINRRLLDMIPLPEPPQFR